MSVRPVLASPSQPVVEYVEIPRGVGGTKATLREMARFARAAASDPTTGAEFVWWCRAITRHVPGRDYEGELRALFEFVQAHVKYSLDPMGLERVQTPYWTLLVDGAGDCDDHATLLCGMSRALGHGAILRAVRVDPSRPDSYSHVYALLGCSQQGVTRWWGADSTQAQAQLGWQPPRRRWLGPPLDLVVAEP
jgi:hypothetical protein